MATVLLGAALLFLVQPLSGRMLLPRFGGAPAVWTTCLLFYQGLLLAGYAWAFWLDRRASPRVHAAVQGGLMLLPLLLLPIGAAVRDPPATWPPVVSLLGTLGAVFGLPYLAIAALSPTLQAWLARIPGARDPYPLYAASNIGSLVGLLAYPLVLEPLLPLRTHALLWSAGYLALALLVLGCGARMWRLPAGPLAGDGPRSPAPNLRLRVRWLLLAFAPSSLLLSVTLHLSTDVAAVPLLWVLPLSLYLVTYALAFARRPRVSPVGAARVMPLAVLLVALVMLSEATEPAWLLLPAHLIGFFITALVCHGELARLRPDPDRLTEFYLWLSAGGVLGGVFSGLAAPHLFRTVAEYPLVLVLACALRPAPVAPDADPGSASAEPAPEQRQTAAALDLLLPALLGLLARGLVEIAGRSGLTGEAALAAGFALPLVLCYTFLARPVRFALGIGALLLVGLNRPGIFGQVVHAERSFFGVHRVTLTPGPFLKLIHGNTVHGVQRLAAGSSSLPGELPPRLPEPTAYYHPTGPAGDLFRYPGLQGGTPVAVVGLGAGALAAYGSPGQPFDFYEIDPAVVRIAGSGRYFTYLQHSPARCRVVLGDARLTLARAQPGRYGLIVLDAFSSDAVPVHLLTREAVELYRSRLIPGGLLAFHVSNRYLDLPPVVGDAAGAVGMAAAVRYDLLEEAPDSADGKASSVWVVLARRETDLAPLLRLGGWDPLPPRPGGAAWSDEMAPVLRAWKWH